MNRADGGNNCEKFVLEMVKKNLLMMAVFSSTCKHFLSQLSQWFFCMLGFLQSIIWSYIEEDKSQLLIAFQGWRGLFWTKSNLTVAFISLNSPNFLGSKVHTPSIKKGKCAAESVTAESRKTSLGKTSFWHLKNSNCHCYCFKTLSNTETHTIWWFDSKVF